MAVRVTPFELVFADFRDRFERVREGLESGSHDPYDRDGFLLQREVAELLLELRPEEGVGRGGGEAMMALAVLVHHAYLFWVTGERGREITRDRLAGIVADPQGAGPNVREGGPRPPRYVRLPALAVWGELEGSPPEPVDGWFEFGAARELDVLAVLGLHPGRPGFTTLDVRGPRPGELARADGSLPFSPLTTATGTRAGLAAVRSEAELLELAWRAGGSG